MFSSKTNQYNYIKNAPIKKKKQNLCVKCDNSYARFYTRRCLLTSLNYMPENNLFRTLRVRAPLLCVIISFIYEATSYKLFFKKAVIYTIHRVTLCARASEQRLLFFYFFLSVSLCTNDDLKFVFTNRTVFVVPQSFVHVREAESDVTGNGRSSGTLCPGLSSDKR